MAVINAVRMALCRVFACSAGGPGFNSRLRRINRVSQRTVASPTLYAEDVGGPGQAPTDIGGKVTNMFSNENYII